MSENFSIGMMNTIQHQWDRFAAALRGEEGDVETYCIQTGFQIEGFEDVPNLVVAIGGAPVKRVSTEWITVEGQGLVAVLKLRTGPAENPIYLKVKIGKDGAFKIARTTAEAAVETEGQAEVREKEAVAADD